MGRLPSSEIKTNCATKSPTENCTKILVANQSTARFHSNNQWTSSENQSPQMIYKETHPERYSRCQRQPSQCQQNKTCQSHVFESIERHSDRAHCNPSLSDHESRNSNQNAV